MKDSTLPEPGKRHLMTFALVAYNHEPFIREAVAAALAQTYSPLEIILSDDCSDDRTFDIMREMAAAYKGPHRIILNRNPVRKSLGRQLNRVVELSRGELIVVASGDDISLPHRVQAVYNAWLQSGMKATTIQSDFLQIDDSGQMIDEVFQNENRGKSTRLSEWHLDAPTYVKTLKPSVFGCANAFSPKLYTLFGNLLDALIHEDNVLALRSILAGRIFYLDEPLVKYRFHSNNFFLRNGARKLNLETLKQQENRLCRDFANREIMYESFLLDLETARRKSLICGEEFEKAVTQASRMHRRYVLMLEYLDSGLITKYRILSSLKRDGLEESDSRILARRLLPRPLLLRMRLVQNYVHLGSRLKAA